MRLRFRGQVRERGVTPAEHDTRKPAIGLDALKAEIIRLRQIAADGDLEDALLWSRNDHAQFDMEVRWCIEALRELSARVAAARAI